MMSLIEPYLGTVKAIGIASLALGLFAGGVKVGTYHVQTKWDADRLTLLQGQVKASEAAIAKQTQWSNQQQEAENAAQKREATLQAAADNAHKSADSLRKQLADNQQRLSSATADAVAQYAATVSDVLSECAADYRGVAEKADAHASDVKTLMDKWPE